MIAILLACGSPAPDELAFERRDRWPRLPGTCAVEPIGCGERIEDDTRCGTDQLESAFYQEKECPVVEGRHVGGRERVYRLELAPGEWTVTARLEPLDGDLDLVQMLTRRHRPEWVERCDAATEEGTASERSVAHGVRDGVSWLAVEPVGTGGGRFRLAVECYRSLQVIAPPDLPPKRP